MPRLERQEIEVTTGRSLGDVSLIKLNITSLRGPKLVTLGSPRGHLFARDRHVNATGVGVNGNEVTVANESNRTIGRAFGSDV